MTHQLIIEIQVLLEIAMSIGNRLDMTEMLKESIHAYLKRLDLSAGAVFRLEQDEEGRCAFTNIFSAPKRIDRNKTYGEILAKLPETIHEDELQDFLETLPLLQCEDGVAAALCNLPGFGLLALIGPEDRLVANLLKSLHPMNDKLANACIACTRNAQLVEEIEKRKRSEARQKRLQAQLEQSKRLEAIGSLAGGIAHDFNNILFPIVGMSEFLIDALPAESREQRYGQQIHNASLRAADLVKQILTFSRQNAHNVMPVSIQSVLKEVLKLCRASIPANIAIKQEIQPNCRHVRADSTQMHQVAMNLITNAYHAVEENNGTISVSLKEIEIATGVMPGSALKPGKHLRLTVSDTGCGIPPRIMDRIFDPYFTTKSEGKGTGLGLATVYGIVKEHRGEITVSSTPGEGSTFDVYLPLAVEKPVAPPPKNTTLQTGSERILLIDDEPAIVQVETLVLKHLGYHVTAFTRTVDAFDKFREDPHAFDLVITDMTMPGMTGDAFSAALRKIRPDIRILICTGYSEKLNKKIADASADGVLIKPMKRAELAEKVREVLDQNTPRAILHEERSAGNGCRP